MLYSDELIDEDDELFDLVQYSLLDDDSRKIILECGLLTFFEDDVSVKKRHWSK